MAPIPKVCLAMLPYVNRRIALPSLATLTYWMVNVATYQSYEDSLWSPHHASPCASTAAVCCADDKLPDWPHRPATWDSHKPPPHPSVQFAAVIFLTSLVMFNQGTSPFHVALGFSPHIAGLTCSVGIFPIPDPSSRDCVLLTTQMVPHP